MFWYVTETVLWVLKLKQFLIVLRRGVIIIIDVSILLLFKEMLLRMLLCQDKYVPQNALHSLNTATNAWMLYLIIIRYLANVPSLHLKTDKMAMTVLLNLAMANWVLASKLLIKII